VDKRKTREELWDAPKKTLPASRRREGAFIQGREGTVAEKKRTACSFLV